MGFTMPFTMVIINLLWGFTIKSGFSGFHDGMIVECDSRWDGFHDDIAMGYGYHDDQGFQEDEMGFTMDL